MILGECVAVQDLSALRAYQVLGSFLPQLDSELLAFEHGVCKLLVRAHDRSLGLSAALVLRRCSFGAAASAVHFWPFVI